MEQKVTIIGKNESSFLQQNNNQLGVNFTNHLVQSAEATSAIFLLRCQFH